MRTIGRFEIVDVIGRGGTGVVYEVRDPELARDLAIKVVPPSEATVEGARAMAKLRHPSVMPVFDVGTCDDGVYIVMPLVRGGTLRDWLAAEPRPWRAVLERFLAAGRGLAAAHAAGLMHGAFDSKDVILGRGREVLVTDFGRGGGATSASDTRDDQQRFCVSLRDALDGRGAPAWLSAALARGASDARARRWPSMNALLGHIEQRLRRPRRIALGAGALAVAGVAAGAVLLLPSKSRPGAEPCPDPIARIDDVWNPTARGKIEQAFAASGSPMAADTVARVVPALDRYAADWRAAHVASCRATHVARTQTAEVLDKRSVCLDRRLAALHGLADVLATADPALVPRATLLPSNLPSIADCADERAMAAQQPLPTDPMLRAQIAALDARIDELDAGMLRGAPPELVEKSRALVADSRAIDYLPVQVRALYLHVKILGVARADLEAEVRELAALAARAKDDAITAYAWGRLIEELVQKARMDEAKQLIPAAKAALDRAEGHPRFGFSLEMMLGSHAINTGEIEPAIEHFEKALRIAGDRKELRAGALRNLAYTLLLRGKRNEAVPMIDEAVRLARDIFGPNHTRYADVLEYQGTILGAGGVEDTARGLAATEEALRIRIAIFGENHPAVAEDLHNLAIFAMNGERLDEADAYITRCLAVLGKVEAPLALASAIGTQADIVYKRQGLDAARPIYERALEAAAATAGERSLKYTGVEVLYAQRLIEAGDCRRARQLAGHAEQVLAEAKAMTLTGALLQLSRCDRREGKHGDAIARLERAVAICAGDVCEPANAAVDKRELGKALVETGRDRARGYQLVQEALETFRTVGPEFQGSVDAIEAWQKQHPPP